MAAPEEQYRGQYRQDAIVDALLGGKTGGVFVDIGAHDGVTLSNTHFFETRRGWTGICFEPNPAAFERLVANRACACENVGVSSHSGTLRYLKVDGPAEMLSGFVDFYDPEHVARIDRELADRGGTKQMIDVPVVELTPYLIERGLTAIDYCSIDTEGGELEILQSIDLERIRVRVLSIENNYWDRRIRDYLRGEGYALVRVATSDEIYGRIGDVRGSYARTQVLKVTGSLGLAGRVLERRVVG